MASVLAKPLIDANHEQEKAFVSKKARLDAEADILKVEIATLLKGIAKKPDSKDVILNKVGEKKLRLEEIQPGGRPIQAPGFVEGNCTSEALAVSLSAGDQSLLSFSPEAGELLRVALGKYNPSQKGDFDLLLSGWSSEATHFNRIGRGRITLCPTTKVVASRATPNHIGESPG